MRASPRCGMRLSWALTLTLGLLLACKPTPDPSLQPAWEARRAEAPPPKPTRTPNPLRSVFFGDLHIHTALSADAYMMGVRALPDDAYTFARGGSIEHPAGYPIRLSRPLDFAAVTDHAEFLGVARASPRDRPLERRSLRERLLHDNRLSLTIAWLHTVVGVSRERLAFADADPAVMQQAWQNVIHAAERHNRPGVFTTFIGYEWTSMPAAANLHRNVIFRGNEVARRPFSALDSEDPEDLWRELRRQQALGHDCLAIPHNANLSNGRMYERKRFDGRPLDEAYAAERNWMEPISEIMQVKGSSETHPVLSSEDEFADFEIYDRMLNARADPSEPKGSYARDALRTGIEMAHTEGFDPFAFGVIGSSDGHDAASPVEEDHYFGKLPILDGSAALRMGTALLLPAGRNPARHWSAAGLAGVWAEENTRAALFDAMRRRETYATSGPRITVRFFGGWDYEDGILDARDGVVRAYAQGVPMGGVLPAQRSAAAPVFAVWALRDPVGANLDRIQIIKAWVDTQGRSFERIFDVAASDGRIPEPATGKLEPVGSTVDVATASYRNSIGAAQLRALWRDEHFDPASEAFYYARVIEIPTPRWTTYDALRLGIPAPEPTALQERAITSAIWYSPAQD